MDTYHEPTVCLTQKKTAADLATKAPDLPELVGKWQRGTANQKARKHWAREALDFTGTYSELAGGALPGECYVTQRK